MKDLNAIGLNSKKAAQLAERILTLGHSPNHNFSKYINITAIKESMKVSDASEAVQDILNFYQSIILLQREILLLTVEAGDEGTNALMSDYIRMQEKSV